jgi:hypothetical protein
LFSLKLERFRRAPITFLIKMIIFFRLKGRRIASKGWGEGLIVFSYESVLMSLYGRFKGIPIRFIIPRSPKSQKQRFEKCFRRNVERA